MAVKIRLKRMGKIRAPYYRIVVADSRTKRDGRVIEEIGKYHPKEDPSFIEVNSERALYWLGVGAQPSEPVAAILKVTGDWQKFTGEPAPAPMLVAEAKRDKTARFNEALKDSKHEPTADAVTPRKAAAKKTTAAEAKAQSDAEAAPLANTEAVEEAVAEAEAPVAQTASLGDATAAAVAEAEDAPAGTDPDEGGTATTALAETDTESAEG
ncbi:MAG: small subunit ribosomal protein [Nocardioidaceae bacterium]|nr:small subunit ribosomal protein [Nocardioidaceae bacterium]